MPADLIPRRCDHCRFVALGSDALTELGQAQCHRYPPPNLWPIVSMTDWCGEWQADDAPAAALEHTHEGQPADGEGWA